MGYIDAQIDECLKEGPQKAAAQVKKEPDRQQEGKSEEKRFEIWYFHGAIDKITRTGGPSASGNSLARRIGSQ